MVTSQMSVAELPWQEQARWKRQDLANSIPQQWRLSDEMIKQGKDTGRIAGQFIESLLDDETLAITSLEAHQIVEQVALRNYTALDVTLAFCKRTGYAQQLGNCLHEAFFDVAITRARELDDHMKKTGKTMGPLHGLPVSLKDQFHVKGVRTSMGYVGWIDTFEGHKNTGKLGNVNSQLVDELYSLGAVLYCKTSVPQTLLMTITTNNVIGSTPNPWNHDWSAGGSSGGECALIAMGGSKIGVGTDIGGSVRIPATHCGLYSLKPTRTRTSYKNAANTDPNQVVMSSAVGYMSSSPDSITVLLKAILSTEPWRLDPDVTPLPWRPEAALLPARLCIGILTHDNLVMPQPPILRALNHVTSLLRAAGHTVIPYAMPLPPPGLHHKFTMTDGGHDIFTQLRLSCEPLCACKRPDFSNNGTQPAPPISYLDYETICQERPTTRNTFAEAWEASVAVTGTGRPLDAVLCPSSVVAAITETGFYADAYFSRINILDTTVAILPVTRADKDRDRYPADYEPISDEDRACFEAYEPEAAHGAPIGVQILGRALDEERVLSVLALIDGLIKADAKRNAAG